MALVVETGSGLSNADSYASVAEADAYVADYGRSDGWLDSLDDQKEQALRLATQAIDASVVSWQGDRLTATQALDWPRSEVELDGHLIGSSTIPTILKRATIELAVKFREDPTTALIADDTTPGVVLREKVKVGTIEEEIEYGSGGKGNSTIRTLVERLLGKLTATGGTGSFVGLSERA